MTLIYSCPDRAEYIMYFIHTYCMYVRRYNNNIVTLTRNNEKPFTWSLDRKSKQFYLLPQMPSLKINVHPSTYNSLTATYTYNMLLCVYKQSTPTVNNIIIVDQHCWCCCSTLYLSTLLYLTVYWLRGNSVHPTD